MPLDTGMAVTKFLTLSLRESISKGCRNTNLLQRDTGCLVQPAPRLRRARDRSGRGHGVRRLSVAAPRARPASVNPTTTARSDQTEASTPPKPVLVVVETAVMASTA